MKKFFLYLCLSIPFYTSLTAQIITQPDHLQIEVTTNLKNSISLALDSLLGQQQTIDIDNKLLRVEQAVLTSSMLKEMKSFGFYQKDSLPNYYQPQLINFYPLGKDQYSLKIAYIHSKSTAPVIRAIVHLIATVEDGNVQFSIPFQYLTKHWSSETIGNITYFYKRHFNRDRARKFDTKNTIIANKLSLTPEKLDFYLCDNYQEVLQLLGFEYDLKANGQTRDGYGIDGGCIFSVMHNEDFSHDVFHYYSGKINAANSRNWITEEGIAYHWGNAYYTDDAGEMIEQQALLIALKEYLAIHPNTSLLTLFQQNTKIFKAIAPEISVRSTISGLICQEIERVKGVEGLLKMINCGRKPSSMKNYFLTLEDLLGINKDNFNEKVTKLLANL